MKNTKEVQAILTALYCINRTSESYDKDVDFILDYAFCRLLGANTNLLFLACAGRTKEDVMPEIMQILEEYTQYMNYIKEYTK